jgi:hypothetical protein
MHASVGREVQSNRLSSVLPAQLSAGPQDAHSQDLGDLIQALGRGHEIGTEFAHGSLDRTRDLVCRHSISNRSMSMTR